MLTLFNRFVKITGYIPFIICFKLKVYYENKRVQGRRIRGKAIIMANHSTVMDFAALMFTFPGRTLRCLMAEVLYKKNPFMTLFLRMLGGIRVERESNDLSFVGKAKRILDRGGVIEIYPEARIPRPEEERPLEFKSSVAVIALESGAPIIPVYSNGCYFTKERARVIIGEPIDARELYDERLSHAENLKNISEFLRQRIIYLKDELEKQQN